MRLIQGCFIFILFAAAGLTQAALTFTTQPSMVKDAGATWKITFAVSENTDVEVSIVDKTDSSMVCHLAAGLLGANAPLPLASNSLSQTLYWDGNNDYRQAVAIPANMAVRVRAGMGVHLDKSAGDPYEYASSDPGGTIYGLTQGSDGSLFIMFRPHGVTSMVLRQFSAAGDYVRTVFPIPGDRPASSYTGWGLNMLTPSVYSPTVPDYFGPLQTNSPLGFFGRPSFVPAPSSGQLGILDDIHNSVWVCKEDGTCDAATTAASKPLVSSPALTGSVMNYTMGARFFAMSPDRSFFLMSGVYAYPGADTGFWRDGRLFKINMATRAATVFFDLDSVLPAANYGGVLSSEYLSELQGVAMDDSGRVFLCDRLNSRILVLSAAGQILKSFPAASIDDLTYCRATGIIYATCRDKTNGLYLLKIADWRNETAVTVKMLLKAGDGPYGIFGYCDNGLGNRTFVSTSQSSQGTLIWVAYRIGGIVLYKESGNTFVEYKNFRKVSKQLFTGLKRLVVDPKTEAAYVVASGTPVQRVSDWSAPAFKPCSTLTGTTKAALIGYDLAVDPFRRNLFVRLSSGSPNNGGIFRYAIGANYLTSAPLSKMATNQVVDQYQVPGTTSVGTADYGFGVAPNGHMAAMTQQGGSLAPEALRYYPVYDTQSAYRPLMMMSNLCGGSKAPGGGVRFDLKGNLYVGLRPPVASAGLPTIITSDNSWTQTTGSIYRYNARGSLNGDLFTSGVSTADKVYDVDFGQLGNMGFNAATCACMTATFGMDGWGRLYAPNGMFQKVNVVDNAGNHLARIGNYGNMDNVSDELSGVTATSGKCYMSYPFAVDATDDFIYVLDPGNVNLLRIKKDFVLDNMPIRANTVELAVSKNSSVALSSSPNPFTPESRIRVMLPEKGRLTLDVVDISGRLVARIASGAVASGVRMFSWNGTKADGTKAAAGVYLYRLSTEKGVKTVRTILAR